MIKLGLLSLLLMPLWAAAFSSKSIPSEINSPISASNNQQGLNSKTPEFMTMRDMVSATLSNVSIQNTGSSDITVTGIYIANLTSDSTDCTGNVLLESFENPYGTLWSPKVTVAQNQIKSIGANYLYNMMMLFLYGAYVEPVTGGNLYTPGNAGGNNQWCLWLGITNQEVGTGTLMSSTGNLEAANILVQFISGPPADPPISFTRVTCDDATRLCSTNDNIAPQPFPHQGL